MATLPAEIFVSVEGNRQRAKIKIAGLGDVYDLIKAVKTECPSTLSDVDPIDITIHTPTENDPLPVERKLAQVDLQNITIKFPSKASQATSSGRNFVHEGEPKRKKPREQIEGVDLDDPLTLHRTKKCDEILSAVDEFAVVLVRSPPFSGKTALGQVLEVAAKKSYHQVFYLSMLRRDIELKGAFETAFEDIHSISFTSLLKTRTVEHTLIIVDEVQKLYGQKQGSFWESLKEIMRTKALGVVLLAAYGESPENDPNNAAYVGTPITLKSTFSAKFLALEGEEMEEYRSRFNKTDWGATSPLSEKIASAIFYRNGGHIGLCATTCVKIGKTFYNHDGRTAEDKKIMELILSREMLAEIDTTRALVGGRGSGQISKEEEKCLKAVIHSPTLNLIKPTTLTQCQLGLIRKGILVVIDNQYIGFAAPIICSIFINRIYSSNPSVKINSLAELLLQALPRINQGILKNSISKGKDDSTLYERQFQVEFYRAAIEVLGNVHSYCSPDVGRIFGSPGYLDFYVDSNHQWGVELVRDSNRLQQHLDRFGPDGIYEIIPFKDFVILNFVREAQMDTKEGKYSDDKAVWKISYNENSNFFYIGRTLNGQKIVETFNFLSTTHQT